jgi:hypothetical protein
MVCLARALVPLLNALSIGLLRQLARDLVCGIVRLSLTARRWPLRRRLARST